MKLLPTFVKDYKNGGKYIEQTIKGTEFLRMFLMHVLPKGFVRIRHYSLLSCRNKKEKIGTLPEASQLYSIYFKTPR